MSHYAGEYGTTLESARSCNNKIETIMNMKQLNVNVDKSSYILLGGKDQVAKIRKYITENPLLLNGEIVKEKSSEKHLGDHIHSEGL